MDESAAYNNEVIRAIKQRRSVRAFLSTPVSPMHIQAIVEAGRFAPSGGNHQYNHFLVITDQEALRTLKNIVTESFSVMEIDPSMYGGYKSTIVLAKRGAYDFIYGAPLFILSANKRGKGNAMVDSAVALENMMVAATSLGLGSCYINQVHWLNGDERMDAYLAQLGLAPDEFVCGGVAFGYSAAQPTHELARRGNTVTYI